MPAFEKKTDERIFEDGVIGTHRLGVDAHLRRDFGKINDLSVRLRCNLQELAKRIQLADQLARLAPLL